jgi:uncharacterized delta-60 repeat protein
VLSRSLSSLRRGGHSSWGAVALLAALLVLPASALAAAGEVDTSFGTGGKLVQNIDVNVVASTDLARDVAIQPDGRIVVAGSTYVNNEGTITNDGFAVLRLTSNGVPDNSNGFPVFSEGGYPGNGASAVALQPDGRILLAGSTGSMGSDFTAARISGSTGNYDPLFGPPNGWSALDFAGADGAGVGTDGALDMALQPDGRVVMAGYSDNELAVGRLTSTGVPDNSFDANCRKRVDFGSGHGGATSVALSGSKIVAAGYDGTEPNFRFAILSLNSDGSPDASFGVGTGRSTNGLNEIPHGANAMAIQPDGKILVAGPANGNFGVGRVKTDGFYDQAFGTGGQVSVDLGGNDVPRAIALQPDGKILVAGTDGDGFAIARLMPDGTVDSSFGADGRATVNFGGVDEAWGMAVQPDGKIVLVGTNGGDFAVTRLLGDPPPPPQPPPPAAPRPPPSSSPAAPAVPTVKCAGRTATIVGTVGKDRLVGTGGADVVAGLGGADGISGLGGQDTICGGLGPDVLKGGPGKDELIGEAGKDVLFGGPGLDKLIGGPGKDTEVK